MNTLLTSIAGQFAKPLLFSALLPVLLVTTLFLLVVYPLFPVSLSPPAAVQRLDGMWQVASASLLAVVGAMLLYVLNTPIVRLLCGYPWKDTWPGRKMAEWRLSEYRRLRTRRDGFLAIVKLLDPSVPAEEAVARRLTTSLTKLAARLNEEFPYDEVVLPTRLGNVIRNFEDYPRQQYGISSVRLWPRLVGVIDAKYVTVLDEAKTVFDFTVNCLVLLAMAALLTIVLAVRAKASGTTLVWTELNVLLFALLAALAYAAAVNRAQGWGSYVKGACDLYRRELLKQLGYQRTPVDTLDEGEQLWTGLSSMWAYPDMVEKSTVVPLAAPPILPSPATSVQSANDAPLTIARGVSTPVGKPYATITVTLRVNNTGTTASTTVTITDTVPANWSLVWGSVKALAPLPAPTLKQSSPIVLQLASLGPADFYTATYQLQSLVATP